MSTQAFGFANRQPGVLERITAETGGHVEYPLSSLYKDVSGYLSTPSDDGNYALAVGTRRVCGGDLRGDHQGGGGIGGESRRSTSCGTFRMWTRKRGSSRSAASRVEIPTLPNVKIRARNGYYPNAIPGARGQAVRAIP